MSPSSTARSPPGTCTVTRVADEPAPVRDRGGRARAGAARQRLADAALPHPHRERRRRRSRRRTRRWCASGSARRARGADRAAVTRARRGVVDEQHEVRVAHPGGVAVVRRRRGTSASRSNALGASSGIVGGLEGDRAHVDGRGDDARRRRRARASTVRRPPPVSTTSRLPSPSPRARATQARQRMPLPLISAMPPSAL